MQRLEQLYKWETITEVTDWEKEKLVELEMYLYRIGIRTQVQEKEGHLFLMVPLKDYQIVKAYVAGEVVDIYSGHHDIYRVFESDLTFKNEKLYEDKYRDGSRKMRRWNFIIIIALFLAILIFFKHNR